MLILFFEFKLDLMLILIFWGDLKVNLFYLILVSSAFEDLV
jgi:hypothetical protein